MISYRTKSNHLKFTIDPVQSQCSLLRVPSLYLEYWMIDQISFKSLDSRNPMRTSETSPCYPCWLGALGLLWFKKSRFFCLFFFPFFGGFWSCPIFGNELKYIKLSIDNGITATRSHWPITFSLVTGWNHVLGQVGCRASWCDSIWGHWNLENYFYIVSSIVFLCNSRCPFEIMGRSLSRMAYMSLGVSQRDNRHFKSGRQENSGHMAQGRLRACEGEV